MFYDKFMCLCDKKGVAPSRAAVDAGISKSLVTKWKNNKVQVPSPDILQKVSAYFNVPVSELLDEKNTAISGGENKNPGQRELTEAEELMLKLFRQIPAESQPAVLEMLRAALKMR